MANTELTTIITIESHGNKFSAELPWDVNLYDLMSAMRGLLVASGYSPNTVDEFIKLEDE